MRYPGHRDLALALRQTGLFDETPVTINGIPVIPREVTCRKLFPIWTFEEGEADLTVMRVIGEGLRDGVPTRLIWDLLDVFDPVLNQTSMSRTTAFPCTICARLIEQGVIETPGAYSLEALAAQEEVVEALMKGLLQRGVTYRAQQEPM